MSKPKILIFSGYYLPGYKAGGPIRSLVNLIERFDAEYEFLVICRDRDLGDTEPYDFARDDVWLSVGPAKVRYLSHRGCTFKALHGLIREIKPDVLYLNSFLDPDFTIKPLILLRLGLLSKTLGVVVASRGEFAQGALAIKPYKKKLFMHAAKWTGLYRNLVWQASSEFEAQDIRLWTGNDADIRIASDLQPEVATTANCTKDKKIGKLRIVCVARVARNKNIDGALRILKQVKADIEFDLYGPSEDQRYWLECQELATDLPPNIRFSYQGQLPHEELSLALLRYDLFFLPTHGENFGHAILEALTAGLPVLISDATPWRHLAEKGIGWDLPLDAPHQYLRVLEECAAMDAAQYSMLSEKVCRYAAENANDQNAIVANRSLFELALVKSG
ncbi:MAG: glycosyltransferase family 4 protein [Pseudomonadota bacterium]